VVSGTTSEKVLAERVRTFQLKAKVVPVKDYAAGVQAVVERKANVFFGDRPILLEAAKSRGELAVIDRRFTDEQIALALKRGDEDYRHVVDRVLSRLYGSPEFRAEYTKWFGQPDERAALSSAGGATGVNQEETNMRTSPIVVLLLGAAWLPAAFAGEPPPAPVIAPATSGDAPAPKDDAARMEISGKVQLDLIYDFKKVDPAWNTTLRPSKIPINCPGGATNDPGCGKDGETIVSPRQTAISFKGFVPTQAGQLKTDLSLDLFNVGGANTGFRLLRAWGEVGAFGAGQYDTPFMNLDLFPIPRLLGAERMIFVRNPQVRYTPIRTEGMKPLCSSRRTRGRHGQASGGPGVTGWTKYPMWSVFSMNGGWGFSTSAGSCARSATRARPRPTAILRAKTGYGVTADASINLFSKDRITTQVTYGKGIASYMNDGGVDLAPAGGIGQGAELVQSIGVMVYYDHYWSSAWASSIGASAHRQDNTGGQAFNAFKQGSYASTNILYTAAKNVLWGAEFLWGQKEQMDGASAIDTRVQFTGQFKF
jgi:hypothetical protein